MLECTYVYVSERVLYPTRATFRVLCEEVSDESDVLCVRVFVTSLKILSYTRPLIKIVLKCDRWFRILLFITRRRFLRRIIEQSKTLEYLSHFFGEISFGETEKQILLSPIWNTDFLKFKN